MSNDDKADLSDYRSDPFLNKQFRDDADHDEFHMLEAYKDWGIGVDIAKELHGKETSIRVIMQQMAMESAKAVLDLIECDFNSAAGVERAKALQSRAIRYKENINWLIEAMNKGNDASHRIGEHLEKNPEDVEKFTDYAGEVDGKRPI